VSRRLVESAQYTSIAFGRRCREAGVQPSMGSAGDCFNNAMCESVFATLECELLARTPFATHEQARREIFSFIEGWYNTHRVHSALDYCSPLTYEHTHVAHKTAASSCGLTTAGQRHGREKQPAARPWTTRSTSFNRGNTSP
jgi:putative transposase